MRNIRKFNTVVIWSFFILVSISSCEKSLFGLKGEGEVVTQEITLSEFNSIDMAISADVVFIKGDIQKVEISAQQNIIDNITKEIKSGEWEINYIKSVKTHKDIKIIITVPNVKNIVLSGSGNISTSDKFTGDEIKFKISGSGRIDFITEIDKINISISGSGDINLAGETNEQEISISGSGNYKSFLLDSNNCDVTISGSGSCELSVEDKLFVSISGSGNVYYKGQPSLNSIITGTGNVIDAN